MKKLKTYISMTYIMSNNMHLATKQLMLCKLEYIPSNLKYIEIEIIYILAIQH
jgi:hypothetical protein